MRHAMGIGRLGLLALGLGIGAALAATPGVASADPSTDPFSWIGGLDLGDLSVPAQAATLDIQISIDGMDLFPTAGNTATATSGMGDIAIAIGNGANAGAFGGIFDSAFAVGTDAGAVSETNGSNFDTAIDIGNNTPGGADGAATGGSFGSFDTAIQIGNNTGSGEGPYAGDGNFDTAIQIGSNIGYLDGPAAWEGNYDTAVEVGNDNVSGCCGNTAGLGNGNLAYSVGDNDNAYAGGPDSDILSNDNIAFVFNPFLTDNAVSYANAGSNGTNATTGVGNHDLAAVLGVDNTGATAIGAPDLYDIVTALGNESGTAASTSGGFLADLLSLF
jgi:hypothetical protein